MSLNYRSRLQAIPTQAGSDNPNLIPKPPIVDPWASRGRFQQVNLGMGSAEERTRVPDKKVVVEETKQKVSTPKKVEETTTIILEDDDDKKL